MGCCHPEKKIEENEIYSFFQKMERENHFTFTIDNYDNIYEQIITLSSNKFKKLKKKQQVRIGFVNEILKNINKIYIEERENRVTKTILFNLLILTLTLANYLKERKNNADNNNSNDMEQSLLTIVIKILKKQFLQLSNLKVVLYYTAKLLDVLFSEINDISQYYNIEDYIKLISGITDEEEILQSKEIYPFIKVNLSCLGECFSSNFANINLNDESIEILINYYIHAYLYNRIFLLDNYKSLNKILFLFNNNNINTNANKINNTENNKNNAISYNNTNTNCFSTMNKFDKENERASNNILKSFTSDFVNKTTTAFSTKKNNNNLNMSNHSLNQSKIKNNLFKNSFVSNMDEFSFSNNNPSIVDILKSTEFKDIKNITVSFYFFLNVIIQDTLAGKKLFKKFDDIIDTAINNLIGINGNELSSKIEINNNKNIFRIIYLILFNKCKLENNTIIILSFLYFISDKIKQEKFKVQYYDLLSQIYFLFNNDNIKYLVVNLFSQSFIKDIENKGNIDIVGEIFRHNQSLFHTNEIKIFKHFLINIGLNFKDIQGISLKIKILAKLSDTLNKYIKNFNKHENDELYPPMFLSTEQRNNKYHFKIDEFISLFQNFELDEDIFHENNYNYRSYFIKYLKFHVNLSIFLADNFTFIEIFKDFPYRKKVFERLIYFITELELFSIISDDNCIITDVIILIEILIKIITKNSIYCLEDFHIITCYLGNSLRKIINDFTNNYFTTSSFYILKLSYSTIIFILIQIKKIFLFPNSITKIHKNIIDSISKCDQKAAEYLKDFRYEYYNETKLTMDIFQDFKKYLKEKKNYEMKCELFNQIIEVIYEKLFGNTSSLFLFFETQNINLVIDEDISKTEGKMTNMSQDHIEYINQIEMKFTEDKEEFSLRKKNEDNINLPHIDGIDSKNASEKESKESPTSENENEYSEHLKV